MLRSGSKTGSATLVQSSGQVPVGLPRSIVVGGGPVSTFVLDSATDSFAVLTPTDSGGWQVRQGGPRRLWDAVESAMAAWEEHGSPGTAVFGVTITRDAQAVWLGNPNGPQWPLAS